MFYISVLLHCHGFFSQFTCILTLWLFSLPPLFFSTIIVLIFHPDFLSHLGPLVIFFDLSTPMAVRSSLELALFLLPVPVTSFTPVTDIRRRPSYRGKSPSSPSAQRSCHSCKISTLFWHSLRSRGFEISPPFSSGRLDLAENEILLPSCPRRWRHLTAPSHTLLRLFSCAHPP